MLDTEQINDLHRLYWSERWSIRKIERYLKMGWRTIRKYLKAPAKGPASRSRSSKLDSFKVNIAEWLGKDPQVTAAVIEQRLRPPRLYRRRKYPPGICPQGASATDYPPRLCPHGAWSRRTV
jgi:hypothetical protein